MIGGFGAGGKAEPLDGLGTRATLSPMPRHYSFEITLVGTKPRVWRAFLLDSAATFHDLHGAIQEACGWEDSHLYEFRAARRGPGIAGPRDSSGMGQRAPDAKRVALSAYFGTKVGTRCLYEYDFGDGWTHDVVLTEIVERDGKSKRILLGGERAFPPEDCGGLPGYERCVALATGKGWTPDMGGDEERAELAEWLGKWKPEQFDVVGAKRAFDR
ncbi:MAG: plasmid pRiA4b ORF-3 family protein [Planctomycetes bacterium]|nr:plasmid pRiA4b ORF-3 family protein [Planctomycetota bacterium]